PFLLWQYDSSHLLPFEKQLLPNYKQPLCDIRPNQQTQCLPAMKGPFLKILFSQSLLIEGDYKAKRNEESFECKNDKDLSNKPLLLDRKIEGLSLSHQVIAL